MIYNRVLKGLKEKKDRVESGLVNCIPWDLPRFSEQMPGIEQARYYIVTGSQKSGKSKITDYLFLYHALLYVYQNPEKVDIKIKYFTLELAPEEVFLNFVSFLLYIKSGKSIRRSPMSLSSINGRKPLSDYILSKISSNEYQELYRFFEAKVELISDCRTPEEIYKNCREYCLSAGTLHTKKVKYRDEITGEYLTKEEDSYYEKKNPEEYFIPIIDNASLVDTDGHRNIKEAIFKLSSKYLIILRNMFKASPVLIQQQAAETEGIERTKLGSNRPTANGLGECKTTARDANYVLGIYSPFKFGDKDAFGYDPIKFKDNIRFLEVIASRHGTFGAVCPLLFLGDVGYFEELPRPNESMEEVFKKINTNDQKQSGYETVKTFFIKKNFNGVLQNSHPISTWKRKNFFCSKFKSCINWFYQCGRKTTTFFKQLRSLL